MDRKVVLITGANRGIGLAASMKFLEEGYTVLMTARNKDKGIKAYESLGKSEHLFFYQLDIDRDESVKEIKDYVEENFGRLDVLVNNAAINYDTWNNPLTVDMNQIMDTINTNVLGAWRLINAFSDMMKSQKSGCIINMSSGLGAFDEMGSGTPAYSISKAALNALTVKIANVYRGTNIKVNSLCPGWVKTDMGGMGAPRSSASAASDIYELASNNDFHGKFIRYNKVIDF